MTTVLQENRAFDRLLLLVVLDVTEPIFSGHIKWQSLKIFIMFKQESSILNYTFQNFSKQAERAITNKGTSGPRSCNFFTNNPYFNPTKTIPKLRSQLAICIAGQVGRRSNILHLRSTPRTLLPS